jgi:protoporphyrinogen oxidase
MNIAIIGAGFTGLTAAYELLKKGHTVTIFEKADQPGGLALGFKKENWQWTLEEYYHHWFTNDSAVLNLAKELEYNVLIVRPKTSSYIDNRMYQLDSPLTFLTFPKLSLWERLRMMSVLGILRYDPFWQPLEKVRAADILPKAMGQKAYTILWKPLLENKFGKYADTISLAWFWARIKKRTPSLAYPEGGFLQFAQTFAKKIENMGGKIVYNADIQTLEENNNQTMLSYHQKTKKNKIRFDKVIVTLPSFAFIKICQQLPDSYRKKLQSLQGIGAITVVLRLKKPFFSDGTYWLNICDTKAPVLAIVEHTNFMDKKQYDNEHLVYLGNYLPKDHPYFSMNGKELLKTFDPLLKKINPNYAKTLIDIDVFQVPFAQPIIPTNYSQMIPSFETPLQNIYLANMQQVYPWDRGTNYAVELGQKIAEKVDAA